MKRIILLFGFILFVSSVYAQNLSCDQLNSTIKSKGSKKKTFTIDELHSSWLQEVTAYSFNGDIYVVASMNNRQYIYCGVPLISWDQFSSNCNGCSYGQRFNKFIKNYKCNCF
ncbi:MAG: hypothetical protein IPG21_14255 [Saprospiraceae bacterium]|nr:hypothetical protein [Candidatus Vicinibacter affinis]